MPTSSKTLLLFAGPLSAFLLGFFLVNIGFNQAAAMTAGVAMWCAIWWVSEAIPLAVTSLIPMAALPLAGVLSGQDIAKAYGHPLIILLMGGFILSQAMSSTGTHKVIAIRLLNVIGDKHPKRIIIGFGVTAAMLSMWISNTATTLMLLPIALAVLSDHKDTQLKAHTLLAIAYCASIGGIATPIGTPPNLIFMSAYQEATGNTLGFSEWMQIGLPISLTLLPLTLWWLSRPIRHCDNTTELPPPPALNKSHKRVLIIFALTALAWMTRSEPFGGWSQWLNIPTANDAAVALTAVIAMFVIPGEKHEPLITWNDAARIPWGVLLLFAGGLALAGAFGKTGLTQQLAETLVPITTLPVIVMMLLLCLVMTFLTEVTSNTATTTLFMPVLAAAGIAAEIDPALLMIPAAISASCAFMLPVATAPNAIVYGGGQLTVQTMAKNGVALNVMGAVLIACLCWQLI